jgi:hypothetical protein
MFDDLRKNHDARPTAEERKWMDADPVAGATRVLVMVGLAVMIGVVASFAVTPEQVPAAVVSALNSPNN